MLYVILIVGIIFAIYFIKDKTSYSNISSKADENYSDSYESKHLLTEIEKSEFETLLSWANNNGFYLFPKVRIFNIIEPRKDSLNYLKLLWKIHSKHIDFVICDKVLKVKFLIELDDKSRKKERYIKRDEFMEQALGGAGYTVLHTNSVDEAFLTSLDIE